MPVRHQARARRWRVALLAVLLWPAALLSPAPAATVKAASQEIIGIRTRSGTVIQTRVLRPAGPGPFPLAIVSHGSPPDAAQRPGSDLCLCVELAARAWVPGRAAIAARLRRDRRSVAGELRIVQHPRLLPSRPDHGGGHSNGGGLPP